MKKFLFVMLTLFLLIGMIFIIMPIGNKINEKSPDNKIINKSEDSLKNAVIGDYFAINNKKIIKEQSFDIVLEELGAVSFYSCAPDLNGSEDKEDVTFYLAKDEMIYQFPFVYTDNIIPF